MTKRRPLSGYIEENWATLSPQFRAAHNKLRQARGLEPIPEPVVDQYFKPKPASPRPFDPNDPQAIASEMEFRGYGDQAQDWMKIAKKLALELAEIRLADRDLHKKMLHEAIAMFVAAGFDAIETGKAGRKWNRMKIVKEAAAFFDVGERTVWTALKEERKKFAKASQDPPKGIHANPQAPLAQHLSIFTPLTKRKAK